MRLAWSVLGIIGIAVAVACLGCGKAQKPGTTTPAPKSDVPLPEWAPENPSPEFMRAAMVLTPLPAEYGQGSARGNPTAQAWYTRYRRTYVPSYEFFGTLSDQQIERFLSQKKLLIRVPSLTTKQRAALDKWFELRREAMKGLGAESEDFLVKLFKLGAGEDLSNVEVGFIASGGHAVHVLFCVTRSDGTRDGICTHFAVI